MLNENSVEKYIFDLQPDRLTNCQSERNSVVSQGEVVQAF